MLFSNIVFTKVYIENVMMRQNKIYKNLSEIKNSEILSIDDKFRNFFVFGKCWYKGKVIKAV